MLRPFLVVGVGGSGGKTLRVVREDLERRLDQVGWTGGIPDAWQFLHIDVPTTADGNDPDLPAQLPERDYQGLIASGIDYRTVDDALLQTAGTHARDALGGWRPDRDRVNVPASKGAGQFRALGRVITLSQLSRIDNAVREARRRMTGAEVTGELQRLTEKFGGKPRTTAPAPEVVVVSSIAGGSGSGAILDVCDAIRALPDKWASESVGILYCPDVFDDIDESLRRGVRANSLAALAELMSGYWNTQGPTESTSELFQAAGISTGASRRLGPRYPFLVGARNDAVTYKTQNDVYRAMGRSIASWVSSAALQDSMAGYLHAQWAATAGAVTDHLRLHPSGTETPFTALGSSRVGLGRDRFRTYASEHLARSVVEAVLERHERLRARDDERPATQLIQEQASDAFGAFLVQTGLDERGEDRNNIIDALQDQAALTTAGQALGAEVLAAVRSSAPAKGFTTDDARIRVRNEVLDRRSRFSADQRAARERQAVTWVAEIQRKVADAAADAIAKHGGRVATVMLRRLVKEVDEVSEELRSEAEHRRRWAANLEDEISGVLGTDRSVTENELESAVDRAVQTLEWEQEAEVRDLAVLLIPDLRSNFLEPLTEAVEQSVDGLAVEQTGGLDGRGSVISTWPKGDIVPGRLKPAPNEFLLESVDTFPQILTDVIARTVAGETPLVSRATAERQVLLGAADDERQKLVTIDQPWVPADARLHSSAMQSATRAAISLASSSSAILTRATAWATRPGTTIGNYLDEGLRGYLAEGSSTPSERADRLRTFEGQLLAALNAGAPLVSINPAVLTRVHGVSNVTYQQNFSEIPLPERSAARESFVRTLQGRGQFEPKVEQSFSDSEAGFIDIFTVLGEPYEPVVFDSLMRPIASDWGARKASVEGREEFWRWRRARSLEESLPLHPETLAVAVKGWFVAGLLEQVKQQPMALYVPASSSGPAGFVPFDDPLLVGTSEGPEALPAVLESLVLALLRVNTQESLEPLRPYLRLLDLGTSESGSLPRELREWIETGQRTQDPSRDARTVTERQDAARQRIEGVADAFDQHFKELEARHDVLGYPGSFDLRHLMRSKLRELHRAVADFRPNAQKRFL
ncbi:tubulin-like doman-containing protein [Georgenia muralis]